MGLILGIGVIYLALLILAVAAFRSRSWIIGAIMSAIMLIGLLALGYLWLASPM